MVNQILKTKILEIQNKSSLDITKWLCNQAISKEAPEFYLTELATFGGRTGGESKLIYFNDISDFFELFYEDIQLIVKELINKGEILKFENDLKTDLCWISIKFVASHICSELDI